MQSISQASWPSTDELAAKLSEMGWRAVGDAQHEQLASYWSEFTRVAGVSSQKTEAANRALLSNHNVQNPQAYHCHKCGLPMVVNPHPEAGVPGFYLEVGCPTECLPCLVLSRHTWAKRALAAEAKLRVVGIDPAESLEYLQDKYQAE